MWLLNQFSQYLFWFFSALKKFLGITTLPAALAVFCILISTVAQTFAFFLPLKVVLLLGSVGVPDYFKVVFGDIAKNQLVLSLSAAAVGFYLLHLLSDYIAGVYVSTGAQRLMLSSKKLIVYPNQKILGNNFYGKMCNSIAASIFVLIAIAVGLALDFALYAALLALLLGLIVAFSIFGYFELGRYVLVEHYQPLLVVVSGVCFLLLFGFIVFSALILEKGNLVFAIINLMLGRQLLQRLASVFRDGVFLSRNRIQFNALFYVGLHYQSKTDSDQEKIFLEVCKKNIRNNWLANMVVEPSDIGAGYYSYWHELGVSNLVGFNLFDRSGQEYAFVKIYGPGREGLIEHEEILLNSEWGAGLPTPDLRKRCSVEGFECLVFDSIGNKVPEQDLGPSYMFILASIWSVQPSVAIVNQYCRSVPMIGDRLNHQITEILLEVANSQEVEQAVKGFKAHFSQIKSLINDLPLSIYNPDLNIYLIYQLDDGGLIFPHWGRWGIEPIGFGWRDCDFEFLGEYLKKAADKRPELTGVEEKHVKLVALLSVFELHLKSHSYVTAASMLPEIMDCAGFAYKD